MKVQLLVDILAGMNEHPLKSAKIAQIARDLDISYEAVRKWALSGEVPPRYLVAVTRITGADPRQLSPGLYQTITEALAIHEGKSDA